MDALGPIRPVDPVTPTRWPVRKKPGDQPPAKPKKPQPKPPVPAPKPPESPPPEPVTYPDPRKKPKGISGDVREAIDAIL